MSDRHDRVIEIGPITNTINTSTGGASTPPVITQVPANSGNYFLTVNGATIALPLPISTKDVDGDTSVTMVESGAAVGGGDRMDFIVDGQVVGSVEKTGPGALDIKWTFSGILDPVIYAGTPRTITQRNAIVTPIKGYLVYISDGVTEEYQYFDGTTWKGLGSGTSTTIINNLTTGGTTDALSAEQGKILQTTKVDKPIAQVAGHIATVNATGDDIVYQAAPATATPSSQAEVTAGTAVANEYVQPDTLKVELDKKLTKLTDITADTKTKITYNADGLVTAGADATAADIVNTPAGNITATNVQTALNELDTEKASLVVTTGFEAVGAENSFMAVTMIVAAAVHPTIIEKNKDK